MSSVRFPPDAVQILQPHLRRKVRVVVGTKKDSAKVPEVEAICAIALAASGRREWTLSDWNQVLAELDRCELTVGQWLETLQRGTTAASRSARSIPAEVRL